MQSKLSQQFSFHLEEYLEDINIDLLYVILGILGEYFGGYSLHDDGVTLDSFTYYNDEQKQNGLFFAKVCEKYLQINGYQSDLKVIQAENLIKMTSPTIHQKIQEIYIVKNEYPQFNVKFCSFAPDDEIFEELHANLTLANRNAMSKKISYLIGAFLTNNYNQKQTYFYNANHKAELIVNLLRQFEGFGSSVRVEYFFNAPCATKVTLNENSIFWQNLEHFVRFVNDTQINME